MLDQHADLFDFEACGNLIIAKKPRLSMSI